MKEQIKVFELNEYDCWAGLELEQVKSAYISATGISEYEAFGRDEAREISAEEMAQRTCQDVNGEFTGEQGKVITFAEALKLMLERGFGGNGEPFFFASTES